jgi:exonuclease VII small subunit
VYVSQPKTTAEEMKLDTNPSDDYHEKKDEIEEHIEELNDMEAAIEKFEEQLKFYKDAQGQLKQNINKSSSIENL